MLDGIPGVPLACSNKVLKGQVLNCKNPTEETDVNDEQSTQMRALYENE